MRIGVTAEYWPPIYKCYVENYSFKRQNLYAALYSFKMFESFLKFHNFTYDVIKLPNGFLINELITKNNLDVFISDIVYYHHKNPRQVD